MGHRMMIAKETELVQKLMSMCEMKSKKEMYEQEQLKVRRNLPYNLITILISALSSNQIQIQVPTTHVV